ncbi:MAG: hypothetical protein CMM29_00705 [Rhodospirillaceae bacterium]|nr:hypothetical protein [Rhodospirillaceae bacterium]|tara:strand:- start:1628 stop:2719 length:1092 start_codon:yes stop_codon:yes gene_type:complete
MTFGNLVGQEPVSGLLRRMVVSERIPPAVLIVGPEGSGKTAAAVALGRAFLCTGDASVAPCEACDNCSRTRMMSHPDLHVKIPMKRVKDQDPHLEDQQARALEAVQDPYGYALPARNDNVSIDRVRQLISEFGRASFQGGRRVAIILHAIQMRPEGANALLKTLEEPPENATMILTAPSLESLLPTIISRCQLFRLGPASTDALANYLTDQKGTSKENADFVARLSGGNVREALNLASDEAHTTQDRAFRFVSALVGGRESQTFVALEQLAAEKEDVFGVLKGAEVWLRDALQCRCGRHEGIVNQHRMQDVEQLASQMTEDMILTLAQEIERVREMNIRNINLQLSLTELWRRTREKAPAGSF